MTRRPERRPCPAADPSECYRDHCEVHEAADEPELVDWWEVARSIVAAHRFGAHLPKVR